MDTYAYAMGQPAGQCAAPEAASAWMQFIPLILIIIVFYFFLLRPQYKKQKEQEKMLNALKKGDEIVLQGGIFGTIQDVEEKTVIVKVDNTTTLKVLKSAVSVVIEKK